VKVIEYAGLTWITPNDEKKMTYHEALEFVEELNHLEYGFTDWHLPTLKEVMPLIKIKEKFTETQKELGHIWIWLNDKYSASRAWFVGFGLGYCDTNLVDTNYSVRAVRSG